MNNSEKFLPSWLTKISFALVKYFIDAMWLHPTILINISIDEFRFICLLWLYLPLFKHFYEKNLFRKSLYTFACTLLRSRKTNGAFFFWKLTQMPPDQQPKFLVQ